MVGNKSKEVHRELEHKERLRDTQVGGHKVSVRVGKREERRSRGSGLVDTPESSSHGHIVPDLQPVVERRQRAEHPKFSSGVRDGRVDAPATLLSSTPRRCHG